MRACHTADIQAAATQADRHAPIDRRGRPRRGRLHRPRVPGSGPRCRPGPRRRGGLCPRARPAIRRADRRPDAAQARRAVGDRRAARQGARDTGADSLGARPGRRPGEGPARRRRRLHCPSPIRSPSCWPASRCWRAAAASRGEETVYRVARPGARPAVAPGRAAARKRSCCSRASSGCSNIS